MSIERIEQTRKVGIFEVTLAINNPIQNLTVLDKVIEIFLDLIETLLREKVEK